MASAALRTILFSGGLFFGLLLSATAGYFGGGGGPTGVRLARVLVPLAIGLAGPSIWALTARSESKDRWIKGEDYRYRGIPKTLHAGKTAIRFANKGKELHIMLWLERKAGDSRPAPEVIGAAFASGTFEGFLDGDPAGAYPGQTSGATMDLPPGRYIVFCPVGVNDNEDDPHFAHGMVSEITVS